MQGLEVCDTDGGGNMLGNGLRDVVGECADRE